MGFFNLPLEIKKRSIQQLGEDTENGGYAAMEQEK